MGKRLRPTFEVQVIGNSLEPSFRAGDVCVVDPNINALPGDSVVVRTKGRALHLASAPAPDGSPKSVLGVVIERRRRLRDLSGDL